MRGRSGLLAWALCVGQRTASAAEPVFVKQAGGAEVRDSRSGLVWQRCSVGQTWHEPRCTGPARTVNHTEALAVAASQAGWRLPSVDELKTLIDLALTQPAIDVQAFPDTPAFGYWSATPVQDEPDYVWMVHFGEGEAHDNVCAPITTT